MPRTSLRRPREAHGEYSTVVQHRSSVVPARAPLRHLSRGLDESGLTYDTVARAVRQVASEAGEQLRTNKSTVEHWCAGTVPARRTARYLAVVFSRRLGRLVTEADLGLAAPTVREDEDGLGRTLEADPIDALVPLWRCELDRRSFLADSAYSVAAAALPLHQVTESASRTAAERTGAVAGTAESTPSGT